MKLRITNLEDSLTKDDLRDIFEEFGDVLSIRIFKDPGGNPQRDFALIEMDSISSGMRAMEALDDDEYEGPPIKAEKFQGVISNDTSKTQVVKPAPIEDEDDDLGDEEYAEGGYKSTSLRPASDDAEEDDLKGGFGLLDRPTGDDAEDEDLNDSDEDYDPYAEDEDEAGEDDQDEEEEATEDKEDADDEF